MLKAMNEIKELLEKKFKESDIYTGDFSLAEKKLCYEENGNLEELSSFIEFEQGDSNLIYVLPIQLGRNFLFLFFSIENRF